MRCQNKGILQAFCLLWNRTRIDWGAGVEWQLGDSATEKLDWFMKVVEKNGIKRQSETVPGIK